MQICVNGEAREVASGTTIARLLDLLDMRPNLVAVERNYELVPRRHHAESQLCEGDTLEIVTLVGGG